MILATGFTTIEEDKQKVVAGAADFSDFDI